MSSGKNIIHRIANVTEMTLKYIVNRPKQASRQEAKSKNLGPHLEISSDLLVGIQILLHCGKWFHER